MSKWKDYKLEDVIAFGNGRKKPDSKGKIPIYGGNGILGYTDKSNYENETIIIGRVGAYCGAVYYENKSVWVSDNALSAKARKGNSTKYLYYFLKNANLNQHAGGSSHPLVTQTLLNSLEYEICDNETEQKAIAEVLSSLDDKIDLLHRQNETLEKMAETLFRKWFVEDADDSWKEKNLGEIGEVNAGGDKPKVYADIKDSNCNIPIYSNGISNEGLYGYTDTARIISESITISARGTIGYVCLRQEPYFPIVRLISITPDESIVSSKYLYLWAKSQNISGTGTTQQQLTVPDISTSRITIPPLKLMNEFTHTVESFFSKKQLNKSQIRTLEKLRDTLLPKLISGEVRVEGV